MNQAEVVLDRATVPPVVALVGQPNVGKTSLFNRLTNSQSKTSNFAGTTVELRRSDVSIGSQPFQLFDVPGLYSFEPTTPEQHITKDFLTGSLERFAAPEIIVVVVDAMNMERTLFLVSEVAKLGIPTIVALNMVDVAKSDGKTIDANVLSQRLNCPVVPVSARTGEGIEALRNAICEFTSGDCGELPVLSQAPCDSCSTCAYADGYRWAATLAKESTDSRWKASHAFTEATDRVVTHGLLGVPIFIAVMLTVFASIFWLSQIPMGWIDSAFGGLAELVSTRLPDGLFSNLLTDGVIAGVGGVLIFLPQICILFFGLALLEDCGYLSRAVVVVDKWMRRVGLPGQAFVPLLAAHACAIPAIMSTRVIASRRDRLAAIFVIPLMTCSARLPVYSMVAAMLFPNHAIYATLLFAAAYALGMVAAFVTAFVLRWTLLPGTPQALIIDLPTYRVPSIANAARLALSRGWAFIRDAGTVILAISVVIWFLSTFPRLSDDAFQQLVTQQATALATGDTTVVEQDTELLRARLAQEHSLLGRMGHAVQPVFEPLGFDWKTSVGVLASFAAREVVVSTLSVLYDVDDDTDSLIERVRLAKKPDGSRVFTAPNSIALLVFFVLAMQCLPTQAVTYKETGSWKWTALQLIYMTVLAYGLAFLAKQVCEAIV